VGGNSGSDGGVGDRAVDVGDEDKGEGSNDGDEGNDGIDRLEGEGEEFANITEPSEAGDDEGSGIDGDVILSIIGERSWSTSLPSVSRSSSASHLILAAFRVRLAGGKEMAGGDGKGDWVEGDDDGSASDKDVR
jgi:hypothetical protein